MNQDNQNMIEKTPDENAAVEPAAAENTRNEAKEKAKMKMTAEQTLNAVARGQMRLVKPIRASDKDVDVLHFDFTKLTGWEFAQALDRDTSGKTNAFRLTQMQAFELFAAAAEKMTPDVDAEDIRHRMGIEDAVKATQIAVVFFNLTSQMANSRITN